MKQHAFNVRARLQDLTKYVIGLENELKQACQETKCLREKLASVQAGTWAERLLEASAIKKGKDLYQSLFDDLPKDAKRRGRMSPYIVGLFRMEFSRPYTFGELQKMKAAGDLTDRQAEIYDAINTFKSACSYGKWLP